MGRKVYLAASVSMKGTPLIEKAQQPSLWRKIRGLFRRIRPAAR